MESNFTLNCPDDRIGEYLFNALQEDLSQVPYRGDTRDTELSPPVFLQRWTDIVSTNLGRTFLTEPLPYLFKTNVWQPMANPEENDMSTMLTEILAPVSRELTDAGVYSTLDALEPTVWWGDEPACFKMFSEVLLIRLRRDDREGGAGVEILPRLPMGRFAFEFYEQTKEKIRLQRGLRETLKQLKQRQKDLLSIEKMGKKFDSVQVLEATIQYVTELEGKKMDDAETDDDDIGSRMEIDNEATLPPLSAMLKASLESLTTEIKRNAV
jgi:hypothetical protein